MARKYRNTMGKFVPLIVSRFYSLPSLSLLVRGVPLEPPHSPSCIMASSMRVCVYVEPDPSKKNYVVYLSPIVLKIQRLL